MQEHWHGAKERETNNFVLKKLLSDQIVQLQKAQVVAAKDQGYGPEKFETHSPDPVIMPGFGGVLQTKQSPSFKRPSEQPWRNYVDYEKDLPVAEDSKALNAQLFKIMHYTDRTAKQRGYLGQKAIVRYLMSVVEDRGGADALAQMLTTKHDAEHGKLNRVGDNEYDPEGFFGTARMQKYVPPWANRKEGALPGYVVEQLKDEKHRSLVETLSQRQGRELVGPQHGLGHEAPGLAREHPRGATRERRGGAADEQRPPEEKGRH